MKQNCVGVDVGGTSVLFALPIDYIIIIEVKHLKKLQMICLFCMKIIILILFGYWEIAIRLIHISNLQT